MPEKKKGGNVVSAVWEIAEPLAKELGLILWDVKFQKEGANWYLRVIIDKEDGIGIDDCVNMNDALDESWKQLRGMEVVSVAIEKITPDDESRQRIEKFDNASMYSRTEYATGRMVDATATAMENAAGNPNGAATGFMGLGMMNGAAGGIVGNPLEYVKQNEIKKEEVKSVNGSICPKCGSLENGNFCSKCGTKLEKEKFCSKCGMKVTGNFCSNCGEKVE